MKSPLKTRAMRRRVLLRQKNPRITATRTLDIFVFNVQQVYGEELHSHKQSLDFLKELGFPVPPSYKACPTMQEVIEEVRRIGELRGSPGIFHRRRRRQGGRLLAAFPLGKHGEIPKMGGGV